MRLVAPETYTPITHEIIPTMDPSAPEPALQAQRVDGEPNPADKTVTKRNWWSIMMAKLARIFSKKRKEEVQEPKPTVKEPATSAVDENKVVSEEKPEGWAIGTTTAKRLLLFFDPVQESFI